MEYSIIKLCVVLLLVINSVNCSELSLNASRLMNDLFREYDHRIRPQYGGPPVEVGLTAYILAISSISEENMEFTMTFYFRQHWFDERLKFQSVGGVNNIVLDPSSAPQIWEPDTFFSSEKRARVHDVLKTNKFIKIDSSGKVLASSRLTVTASCLMNLKYFPMDSQVCSLEGESYGMTASDIIYKWQGDVGISPEAFLPRFKWIGHRTSNKLLTFSMGSYSRITIDFLVSRNSGYYLLTTYMPAVLIVLVSWTAFYMTDLALRVIVGVISTFTALALAVAVNMSLPQVSYVKAIDIYLFTCLALVLASLLINTFIEHLDPRQRQRHGHKDLSATDVEGRLKAYSKPIRFYGLPMNLTDSICVIGLIAVFFVFNLLYFIICAYASDVILENIITNRP